MIQLKSVLKVLGMAAIIAVPGFAIGDAVTDGIKDRTHPVGTVCMSGDSCAAAPVAAVAAGPRSGEEVYSTKCFTCHATGAAGAPKLGDVPAWGPRLAKGLDVLFGSAISGFKGMPAKGLCMDCSDDEIKAAVEHMVNNSK